MKLQEKRMHRLARQFKRPVEEFLVRADGRIEWVCEHSIGHTVWFPKGGDAVHGCDECCEPLYKLVRKV